MSTIYLIFLLPFGLTADNLEKTQKKRWKLKSRR